MTTRDLTSEDLNNFSHKAVGTLYDIRERAVGMFTDVDMGVANNGDIHFTWSDGTLAGLLVFRKLTGNICLRVYNQGEPSTAVFSKWWKTVTADAFFQHYLDASFGYAEHYLAQRALAEGTVPVQAG